MPGTEVWFSYWQKEEGWWREKTRSWMMSQPQKSTLSHPDSNFARKVIRKCGKQSESIYSSTFSRCGDPRAMPGLNPRWTTWMWNCSGTPRSNSDNTEKAAEEGRERGGVHSGELNTFKAVSQFWSQLDSWRNLTGKSLTQTGEMVCVWGKWEEQNKNKTLHSSLHRWFVSGME